MRLSQTALCAIVASSAFVSAAPAVVAEQTMIKREDVNDVLAILKELKEHRAKREFLSGDELIAHDKRADSVIGQLITALTNSGIIGDVWNILTTDQAISSSISAIIQSAIQTAVVQGPALIQAVWNSGLLGTIFNKFLNDADLRNAFLDVAASIFGTAVNLITSWLSSSSSTSSKRDFQELAVVNVSARDIIDSEYLDKRDLASILTFIVEQIKDSGIVTSVINWVLNDPQATVSFLTSAFQTGLVVAEQLYGWAKQSGLWDSALTYIQNNAGQWAGAIASFLGNALTNGLISASDIDSRSGSSLSARSVVSTAAPQLSTRATTVVTSATGAGAAAAPKAATAATGAGALSSLVNQYGTATTAPAIQANTANLAGSLNTLVNAANSASTATKARRNY
ncbi:uncharacterized protein LODBEIA_P07950 [Lodderomyces beijingensis]|uniref:Opaque-phase-specific protein OP4 n=1 Tax=Lodderomyces beijingensis TaxID=1775926 RepID=A0ABP0ZID4_9ASCO